jgi:hypothetical protein
MPGVLNTPAFACPSSLPDHTRGAAGFAGFSFQYWPTCAPCALCRSHSEPPYSIPCSSTEIDPSVSSPVQNRNVRVGGPVPVSKGPMSQPCTRPPEFAK